MSLSLKRGSSAALPLWHSDDFESKTSLTTGLSRLENTILGKITRTHLIESQSSDPFELNSGVNPKNLSATVVYHEKKLIIPYYDGLNVTLAGPTEEKPLKMDAKRTFIAFPPVPDLLYYTIIIQSPFSVRRSMLVFPDLDECNPQTALTYLANRWLRLTCGLKYLSQYTAIRALIVILAILAVLLFVLRFGLPVPSLGNMSSATLQRFRSWRGLQQLGVVESQATFSITNGEGQSVGLVSEPAEQLPLQEYNRFRNARRRELRRSSRGLRIVPVSLLTLCVVISICGHTACVYTKYETIENQGNGFFSLTLDHKLDLSTSQPSRLWIKDYGSKDVALSISITLLSVTCDIQLTPRYFTANGQAVRYTADYCLPYNSTCLDNCDWEFKYELPEISWLQILKPIRGTTIMRKCFARTHNCWNHLKGCRTVVTNLEVSHDIYQVLDISSQANCRASLMVTIPSYGESMINLALDSQQPSPGPGGLQLVGISGVEPPLLPEGVLIKKHEPSVKYYRYVGSVSNAFEPVANTLGQIQLANATSVENLTFNKEYYLRNAGCHPGDPLSCGTSHHPLSPLPFEFRPLPEAYGQGSLQLNEDDVVIAYYRWDSLKIHAFTTRPLVFAQDRNDVCPSGEIMGAGVYPRVGDEAVAVLLLSLKSICNQGSVSVMVSEGEKAIHEDQIELTWESEKYTLSFPFDGEFGWLTVRVLSHSSSELELNVYIEELQIPRWEHWLLISFGVAFLLIIFGVACLRKKCRRT